jgi:4-amino-4-deoxychorismate lyase
MNKARWELFSSPDEIRLEEILEVQDNARNGLFKCRVIYNKMIKKIEWTEYVRKKVDKLKIVEDNSIAYSYKFLERKQFEELSKRNTSLGNEEILIVKNGLITDTSYTNVVLFNGKEWCTPANPLLKGTQRQKRLSEKRILEKEIALKDLKNYTEIKLINAMMEFDDAPTLLIDSIT